MTYRIKSSALDAIRNMERITDLVNQPAIAAVRQLTDAHHIASLDQSRILNNIIEPLKLHINSYLPEMNYLTEGLSVKNLIDQNLLDSVQDHCRHINFEVEKLSDLHKSLVSSNLTISSPLDGMFESLNINSIPVLDSTHDLINTFNLTTTALDALQSSMNSTMLEQISKHYLDIGSLASSTINNLKNFQSDINVDPNETGGLFDHHSVNGDALSIDNDVLSEALESIQEEKDCKQLPDNVRAVIIFIFNLVANALISYYVGMYWYELQQMQSKLQQAGSVAEVKRTMKEVGLTGHREFFKGYRVTTGKGIRLRNTPNMKSDVILELPIGKMLNVLDKSGRAWLYVEVEVEDELMEGWVARSHTDYFK